MWGCLQWLDAGPTKAAKAAVSGAKAPCPVPGSAVQRPKIAAVERRTARHPQAGMSTPERVGLCSTHGHHAWRELFDAPVGAPLPRICFRARKLGPAKAGQNGRRARVAKDGRMELALFFKATRTRGVLAYPS